MKATTVRRQIEQQIIQARTYDELLDAVEASHGVLTDEQFAAALAEREQELDAEGAKRAPV